MQFVNNNTYILWKQSYVLIRLCLSVYFIMYCMCFVKKVTLTSAEASDIWDGRSGVTGSNSHEGAQLGLSNLLQLSDVDTDGLNSLNCWLRPEVCPGQRRACTVCLTSQMSFSYMLEQLQSQLPEIGHASPVCMSITACGLCLYYIYMFCIDNRSHN